MRTIDADAALKALRKCQTYLYDARDPELKIELSSAEAAISNLPTIQPEKAQLYKEGTTSDLISRTETVEHFRMVLDATVPITDYDEGYVDGVEFGISTVSTMPTIQPVATDTNVGDTISKFIDGLEEIFADLRERHVDDSVCGLCEYDGAYIGQSGDWCNECPGFDRDDCFKLSDETRKKWTDEIIKALPPAQPEPQWIPVSERLPEEKDAGILKKLGTEKKSEYVLATAEVKGERMTVTACTYDGKWDWNMKYAFPDFKVIAWMPLPEPYTK